MSVNSIETGQREKITEPAATDEEVVGIWGWGAGTDGQLGSGTLEDQLFPQPLHLPYSISHLACGGAHTIALTCDGKVLTWGRGTKGQLGHGELNNCSKPKVVEFFGNLVIYYVSAGWNHSGFVTDSGCLFMCGDGSFGQLGVGDYQSHSSPTEVSYFATKNVHQVACGMRHSLVLVRGPQGNIIYGFGSTRHGQIGGPLSRPHGLRSCNLPVAINGLENRKVLRICANGDQSAALLEDGELYTWGKGVAGSLASHCPCAFPSSLRFSQVALGWNHALGIADRKAYMLGGKHHGQLSSGHQARIEKQQSSTSDESENVSCIGEEKVIDIAAGSEHSALVTERGKIMTWGWGEHGQLGLGDTIDQTLPHTVNIVSKGHENGSKIRVYCGSGFTLAVKLL